MINQAATQKKLLKTNKNLWRILQVQSIIEKFSTGDTSKNKHDNLKCLNVLNQKISQRPTGFNFDSRDCTNSDTDVIGCELSKKPKIFYLKGTGDLPDEWNLKIPVLPSQCCSPFYEDIITKAKEDILNLDFPANIKEKIEALPASTSANRKMKVKEVVNLIIDDPTPLNYAKDVCGLGRDRINLFVCNEQTEHLLKLEGRKLLRCDGTNWVSANLNPCRLEALIVKLGSSVRGCRKGRGTSPSTIFIRDLQLEEGINKLYIKSYASVRKQGSCGAFYHSFDITCKEDGTFDTPTITFDFVTQRYYRGLAPFSGATLLRTLPRPNSGGWHTLSLYHKKP